MFTVPARTTIEAREASYEEACSINQQNSLPRRKISKQSFAILGKIRELDDLITPAMQKRLHEVHPEVSFSMMNGGVSLKSRKKDDEGRKQRISLLIKSGFPWMLMPELHYLRKHVALDDLVDACACAWSARRISEGAAITFPHHQEYDARGLEMSIKA